MSEPTSTSNLDECLQALACSESTRPPGLVDWMHYGFMVRYGGDWEPVPGEEELKMLEELAASFDEPALSRIHPLFEAHAWTAGRLLVRRLPELLWARLASVARGRFLAGLSRHLSRARKTLNSMIGDTLSGAPDTVLFDVISWISERLASASLDAESAVEIGANAIHANSLEILASLLARSDLPEGPVRRLGTHLRSQERWEEHLSQHSTSVMEVMLEAAVRCNRSRATRLLLEHGANPNIPCWNLERSYKEWFSALSFSIHAQRESDHSAERVMNLLLLHGADPQGLECEGRNNPLMHALLAQDWALADRLIALGARFEGGQAEQAEETLKYPNQMPLAYPRLGFRKEEDLAWIQESIAPLVPLAPIASVPLYYQAHAMIGSVSTFLNALLTDEQLPMLQHYEILGLPTTLTPTLMLDMVDGGCHGALCHLLRDNPNLPRVMFRIRRRKHDFGAASRQVLLCRPEPDGSNVLENFEPDEDTALPLPDGSRLHAFLPCIAPPGHNHGPVTEGTFWLESVRAEYLRRRDRMVTRNVRRIWRMQPVPENVHQIDRLIPIVKEVDRSFIWLGITAHDLRFNQKMPGRWHDAVEAWHEGEAWQCIIQRFTERLEAQRATNLELPAPVLTEDELKPYPREFWPFLRRHDDGTIGMTEESCRAKPDVLDIYGVWERQNKPDQDFVPDRRLLEWPDWPQVPVELRPYFYFDELFGKPSVTFRSRNEYEKEMIHKAVAWSNGRLIQRLKKAGL